jgi:WD40 repeat protein
VFSVKTKKRLEFKRQWDGELADYVTAIAWSPDGKTLVASSAAGEVAVYRGPSFEASILQPIQGHSIDCCVFSQDGQFLAVGGQTGQIKIWRIQSSETTLVTTIPDIVDWVDQMAWSPTDNLLAFSRGRYVQIWDPSIDEIAVTLDFEASSVLDIAWHPDGTVLAVGGYQGIRIWTVNYWNRDPYILPIGSASLAIAWSPDGKYIASGNMDRTVMVLEWGSMAPWMMDGFAGKVGHLTWSSPSTRRGSILLAAASIETIAVWVRQEDSELWDSHLLLEHSENVRSIGFQPATELLASAAADNEINLWSRGRTLAQKLSGADSGFACLAWNHKGDRLAAGGQNGELLVWAQTQLGFGRR